MGVGTSVPESNPFSLDVLFIIWQSPPLLDIFVNRAGSRVFACPMRSIHSTYILHCLACSRGYPPESCHGASRVVFLALPFSHWRAVATSMVWGKGARDPCYSTANGRWWLQIQLPGHPGDGSEIHRTISVFCQSGSQWLTVTTTQMNTLDPVSAFCRLTSLISHSLLGLFLT